MKKADNEEQKALFSARLRKAMDVRGMKAVELSDRTGIDKGSISNYLKGRYLPKNDKIYLMASALSVNPAWLSGIDQRLNTVEGLEPIVRPVGLYPSEEDIVSIVPWDPDELFGEGQEDETIRIMARGMHKMTPENRKMLLNVAKTLFASDFDEEGNKK